MKYEISCGSIVINDRKVLIVKHNAGHFDFPKGHMEENETKTETAIREVKEETNIDIRIVNDHEYKNTYSPKEGVMKDVIFFRGEATSFDARVQEAEISEILWVDINDVLNLITYENTKNLFRDFLESEDISYE